jgi:hypothetical protein
MIDATLHQIGRMLAHRTSTVTTGARRMKSGRCTTTKYQDEPGNRKTAGGTRSRPEITYPPAHRSREVCGRGREDEGRPGSENPVARVRRRQQLQQSEIAQAGGPLELARHRLVRNNVIEGHHRPRDQVPVFGQAQLAARAGNSSCYSTGRYSARSC